MNHVMYFFPSDLFAESQLTQPPKGVLLHGPPGKIIDIENYC